MKKSLYSAGVPRVEIERSNDVVTVYLHCARPGIVIGKGGAEVEKIRLSLEKLIGKKVKLSIVEVRNPDMDAQLVAENIAQQLEKRISHRRAMKNAMGRAMRAGAKGIKCCCSGRLGGREIAGVEHSQRHHSAADHPCRYRLWFCRSGHHFRPHRRQGLDLQGRSPEPDPAHHPPHDGYHEALSGAS